MLGKQPRASPALGAPATSNCDGCLCEFKLENRVAGDKEGTILKMTFHLPHQ